MKKWLKLGAAALLFICLTGCAGQTDSKEQLVTNVEIQKDGKIVHTIYSDFKEAYYNVEDLTEMVQTSMKEYRLKNPDSEIVLKKCELIGNEDRMVKVVMEYDNCETYTGFNGKTLFEGTIQEAYEKGYDLDRQLQAVSEKEKNAFVGKDELLNMGTEHIVICEENLMVRVYGKVKYIGKDMTLTKKNAVIMEQTQGNGVFVFK